MEATTLWDTYQQGHDLDVRAELVEKHLPFVHHVARQMLRSLTAEVELDDLVSAGTIGLINAIETFDPSRGLAFSTYAAPRIRGAILDDLRRWDHASRSVRRKQRTLASARQTLASNLSREPDARETAAKLGIEVEKLFRWEADAEEAKHISLDGPIQGGNGRPTTPAETVVGTTGEEIELRVNGEQEVEALRRELLALPERDRLVLSLYYFEELKLHQIADVLGLTESRISQIRSKALATLRERMAPLREVEA